MKNFRNTLGTALKVASVAGAMAVAPIALAGVANADSVNWDAIAACESSGNWAINTGNGYYGGVQFSLSTWRSVGGVGLPHQNSKAEQVKRAEMLRLRSGLGQWPTCGPRWHG